VATTTQIIAPARVTIPLALWHLLSLDAPTVAALWTWFIARANHVQLSYALPVAMFLAGWVIYAADRLLDMRHLVTGRPRRSEDELEARHLFHFVHRRAFLASMPFAAIGILALLPNLLPVAVHLYLLGGVLLLGWFLVIHAAGLRLPKEVVVGLYFAAATFAPTLVRAPVRPRLLMVEAVLFAALCTLNCLFIHAWERSTGRMRPLLTFAALLGLASCAFLRGSAPAIAIGISAALLFLLHCRRDRLSRTHLRCAADLALLTPVLLLPFLR
jgi:hypothetical protein